MGARRSCLGVALLVVLVALAPAANARRAAPSPTDESVAPIGSLVYAWHGDPARGCAQIGVCGVHGALVLQPQITADVLSDGGADAELLFSQAPAIARVEGGDLGTAASWPGRQAAARST